MIRRLWPLAALVLVGLAAPASAEAAPENPFGHPCTAENGVRFCPTNELIDRIPTWDGTPIDIDVTLPPRGNGPFPTIVMLHAFGLTKTLFESKTPQGPQPNGRGSILAYFNNNFYAKQGYAVINYTARGFGRSCGEISSRALGGCENGYWHYADQRWEIRDTQYLLGMLVDQGIVDPKRVGATGVSWGGGQSSQLAFVKNRVRMPDGSFVPWKSPSGTPIAIKAAVPKWQWSDLGGALVPNGLFLDFNSPPGPVVEPVGVENSTYVDNLFLAGETKGYIAPRGKNPQADPLELKSAVAKGEPYGADVKDVLQQLRTFSGITRLGSNPTPLLIQDGWNDDLFPPYQMLRTYNILRSANRNFPVALQFGDVGHPRGSNKPNTNKYFNFQAARFFDYWLRGNGKPLSPGSVTAFTTTCPQLAAGAGPYKAASYNGLAPGAYYFGGASPQTVDSDGGSTFVSLSFTAIYGTTNACKQGPVVIQPQTASYRKLVDESFTLLGLPTVRATIDTKTPYSQLDAHLWDTTPNGQQRLVARTGVRLTFNQTGKFTFQLSGNGYRFKAGHLLRLELVGRDPFTRRPSNGGTRLTISNLSIELPTLEPPGSKKGIKKRRTLDPYG